MRQSVVMNARIIDLCADDSSSADQAAQLLFESFRGLTSAWPSIGSARGEVSDSLSRGRISRVMLDDAGRVIGWIGGQPHYDGRVWELHPMVVAEPLRRQGLGRLLVQDLERIVASKGALTLMLGTDDETDATSLSGTDLSHDLPGAIRDIRNLKSHPYEFYLRVGFRIVGVMPDANGPGKPDIYMAKRVGG